MVNAYNAIAPVSANFQRRNFLLTAGLGLGSAAALTIGVATPVADVPGDSLAKQSKDRGYQATEHVRNYYRTART